MQSCKYLGETIPRNYEVAGKVEAGIVINFYRSEDCGGSYYVGALTHERQSSDFNQPVRSFRVDEVSSNSIP